MIKKMKKGGISIYYFKRVLPVWVVGTIIDLETRTIQPTSLKLTGLGIIKENKLYAYVLHNEVESGRFLEWAKEKVLRCPRPYISYNKKFEESWLGIDFDIEIQPEEMIPKADAISLYHIRNTPNFAMILAPAREIMYHLVCDLLEELALYVTLAHMYRKKEFRVSYIDNNFPD